MIISDKHRFIFIAVNKTGTSSIHSAFREIDVPTDTLYIGAQPEPDLHHASVVSLRDRIGVTRWNAYLKFAFVRNPWDRLVSFYYYLKNSPWVALDATEARRVASFQEWVLNDKFTKQMQTSLLCDIRGTIDVDFIGRYEHLNEDFERVCSKIGVSLRLPHINSHSFGDYVTHYDALTLARANPYMELDAARFNYQFGG